jgi:hypothetical protein
MPRSSESGHAKNIATAANLIEDCKKLGAAYKPSNGDLKVAALELVYNSAAVAGKQAEISTAAFHRSANLRLQDFRLAEALAARIVRAFKASGAPTHSLEQLKGAYARLKGWRKTPVEDDPPSTPGEGQPARHRSVSQRSFIMMESNFSRLVEICRLEPAYHPGEEDLTIVSLDAVIARLRAHNLLVPQKESDKTTEIKKRNELLYADTNGLVAVASTVKSYVESLDEKKHPGVKEVFQRHKFRTLS